MNRAQRRAAAKELAPKEHRKDVARRLKPPPVADVARANLERMGLQIVEARQLLEATR